MRLNHAKGNERRDTSQGLREPNKHSAFQVTECVSFSSFLFRELGGNRVQTETRERRVCSVSCENASRDGVQFLLGRVSRNPRTSVRRWNYRRAGRDLLNARGIVESHEQKFTRVKRRHVWRARFTTCPDILCTRYFSVFSNTRARVFRYMRLTEMHDANTTLIQFNVYSCWSVLWTPVFPRMSNEKPFPSAPASKYRLSEIMSLLNLSLDKRISIPMFVSQVCQASRSWREDINESGFRTYERGFFLGARMVQPWKNLQKWNLHSFIDLIRYGWSCGAWSCRQIIICVSQETW
jgi:hypothetical protein